ncbi:hypothetical protein [Algoriphagus antarcticus]|uniref:Uncharacterized protein n=1 Tax=Algoriphagus antarcticus TaxID=238540 RepID=A0A3E0D699_9BACT|nr:hypothetical protein [Algoriphagus antarcticus]REG78230.1 hypothetical protein C8N25_13924 [Algoriphagus antarcticus]
MSQIKNILELIKNEGDIRFDEGRPNAKGQSRIEFKLQKGHKHAKGYLDMGEEAFNVSIRESNYSQEYLKRKLNLIFDTPASYLFGEDVAIGEMLYLDGQGKNEEDYQVGGLYTIEKETELFQLKDGNRCCNPSSTLQYSVNATFERGFWGSCVNSAGYPKGETLTLVFEITAIL